MLKENKELKVMDFWKRLAAIILLIHFLTCFISGALRVVEIKSIFDTFLPTLSGWILLVMAMVLWGLFKRVVKHDW